MHNILYHQSRGLTDLTDKLSIASIFIFCEQSDAYDYAELLYGNNPENFIAELNDRYKEYEIDFTVRFERGNVKDAFDSVREAVKKKFDSNGFYKALYERDEFAIVTLELVNICDTLTKSKNINTFKKYVNGMRKFEPAELKEAITQLKLF